MFKANINSATADAVGWEISDVFTSMISGVA